MNQVFHLDLFLEHLVRVEESTQAFRSSGVEDERRREVDRAYNGILDALDAIAGYRTLLARQLIELDARRRVVLELVEADSDALQSAEETDPFRPFWTRPWAFFLNVGLLPIRLAGWLSKVRVRRDRDVLDRVVKHRDLQAELTEAVRKGARPERIRRLETEVERARRAVEELTGAAKTKKLRRVEDLVEHAIENRQGGEARMTAPRDRAEEIFGRTRTVIERLRAMQGARATNDEQIDAIDHFIADLPRASCADVILKERARLYDHVLVSAASLIEEVHLCRTLTGTLDKARTRMESLFPYVSEKALSSWIHDPESRDPLEAVRGTLGTLAALTGKTVSPNLEVEPPVRTLPALLAGRSRFDRSRPARLRRWVGSNGPRRTREVQPLVDVPVRLADRARALRERVVGEFDRTAQLLAALRRHLGTVSYRIANPLHVYRREVDNARFERHFLLGAVNKLFAYTLGLVTMRILAAALAVWAVLSNLLGWFRYFRTRGHARRLRAQTEKILREFAEELEAMAGGVLAPGEARADHLLLDASPEAAARREPRGEVDADVLELLRLYHEIHVGSMTFGATWLQDAKTSRALMKALEEHERRILAQLRSIRLRLEALEEELRREAEFPRRAIDLVTSAEALGDATRARLAMGLVRFRERLREAGLDPSRLSEILDAAREGQTERRVLLVMKRGHDFEQLAELVWRASESIDDRRLLERTLEELAGGRYAQAQGTLEAVSPVRSP